MKRCAARTEEFRDSNNSNVFNTFFSIRSLSVCEVCYCAGTRERWIGVWTICPSGYCEICVRCFKTKLTFKATLKVAHFQKSAFLRMNLDCELLSGGRVLWINEFKILFFFCILISLFK